MLKVADVMSRRPVAVEAAATVTNALDAMKERGISSVLVSPLPGSAEYGILTMRDIMMKVIKESIDPQTIRVGDIMTWHLVTARSSWTLQQVAELMARARVRRLPVVEDSGIAGLVSDTDIFTALIAQHEWEHVRQVRKQRALRKASLTGPVKTVADLMSSPVLTTPPGAPVEQAVRKMVAAGISSLLVTTDEGGAHGIVTKRDVVTKVVAAGRDLQEVTVGELMSSPVLTIGADATLEECSSRMVSAGVRRFPVARTGQIVGIISDSDILMAVAGHRWLGHRRGPTSAIVADVMRTPAVDLRPASGEVVSPELSLWECAAKLSHAGVRELPVMQGGRIIGIVSDVDIVRALEERGAPD